MANQIQIKRTSISGRAANTTTLTNPGELALNMTDGIMYSTNGSVVFEIGANNTSIAVGNSTSKFIANTTRVSIDTSQGLLANGSIGTAGQFLTSNGTTVYWSTPSTGVNAQQNTYTYTLAANTTVIQGADDSAATLNYSTGLESVFINGVRQISGVDYNATNATAITLTANAIAGEVVQVVTWTGQVNTTNVNAQFVWTNTHIFNSLLTVNNNLFINSGGDLIISSATGGANTALYNDAADLYIAVNNATRGYFASNGNFGVGTTSPGYKATVNGSFLAAGQSFVGYQVAAGAPSGTGITSTAHTLLGGNGGNYLAFGQYGSGQSYAQWIQSTYEVPNTAKYNLVLQPIGGSVLVSVDTAFDNVSYCPVQALNGVATKVAGTAAATQMSFFNDNGRVGYIGTSGTATTYYTSSDERMKKNMMRAQLSTLFKFVSLIGKSTTSINAMVSLHRNFTK
jgi:hypothetical protein